MRLTLITAIAVILGLTGLSDITEARPNGGCFRGAILDQVMQVDASSKLKSADLNLELYERSAKVAKDNGADIIVFPEDGIIGMFTNRSEAHLGLGETIPETKGPFCDLKFAPSNPIVYRLACIAKANQIFVTANMIDVQPCSKSGSKNSSCPDDGFYAFNTAVLFDRQGALLAKYHKIHLFGEMAKNVATEERLVVVETEIGRLGLQICFDLLFKTPGHLMAQRGLIDTLLFPTSWVEESPFLGASQIQMSWAFSHGVNLLAANNHHPQASQLGSGIYVGSRQFEVIRNMDASTRLLVATLPVDARLKINCPLNATTVEIPMKAPGYTMADPMFYFRLNMNLNDTILKRMEANQSKVEGCFNGVCCKTQYKMNVASLSEDDQFYLVAANRSKPGPFPMVEEFCAVIHCPTDFEVCSTIRSDSPLKSKFHFVHLEGNFHPNTTVFPTVIGSQHQVLKRDQAHWSFKNLGVVQNGKQQWTISAGEETGSESYALGTVGLYGRAFDRDPPFHQIDLGMG